ncbi:hypothetical protein M2283_004223 [Streptomyces pseudovenezuelae]|uniref:Uncharacterized protein n=1 Tax=Streptomyces pseudovenezuelae TaxID=67350 RepID=A0ABT6LKS2_9ACTN|nr:hypothetical protein [Streptomyces pseudovenezuelae]
MRRPKGVTANAADPPPAYPAEPGGIVRGRRSVS